jgi:hypothetical protein
VTVTVTVTVTASLAAFLYLLDRDWEFDQQKTIWRCRTLFSSPEEANEKRKVQNGQDLSLVRVNSTRF